MRKQKQLILIILFSLLLSVSFLYTTSAFAETEKELAAIQKIREENARCLRCHGAEGFKTNFSGELVSLYVNGKDFLTSVHESNSCLSCHVGMTDYPHKEIVYGTSFRVAINQRCQYCHEEVAAAYNNSIHGELLGQGKKTALCSDCHGNHNIFKKTDPRSKLSTKNQVFACTKCHEEKMESYNWGIHGKSAALGSKKPATCAVCHTSHSIWGPKDPRSSISKANTPKTCAQCHVKEPANFAEGIEHYTLTPEGKNAPMYYTYKFFTWLTIFVVAFVLIYIELELFRRIKNAKK